MTSEQLAGVPDEKVFYVTFGVRYRQEAHPQGMSPDGWAVIIADDDEAARLAAHELYPDSWAFLYDHLDRRSGRFNPAYYPAGILAVHDKRASEKQ